MPMQILIVEDEPAIAETLIYALSTEGFVTQWCVTGQEALVILKHTRIDLVLLDVGLPDINGVELLREIQRLWSMPVIFLTARSTEIDRIVGLELGADDYISKPFSPREVCARVRVVLRRVCRDTPKSDFAAISGAAHFVKDHIVVDHQRKIIRYLGQQLELSKIEYRLLTALTMCPGQVYSRNELMKMAWEHPDVSLDRTVDAHIKQLRSKLKEVSPEVDPIQTHRGMGYSFKELA